MAAEVKEVSPEIKEDRGALVGLTRNFIVTGMPVPSTLVNIGKDVLALGGLPPEGDVVSGYENLIAVNRKPTIRRHSGRRGEAEQVCVVDVEVEYVPKAEANRDFIFQYDTGLVQEITQRDAGGNALSVTYNDGESDDTQIGSVTATFQTVTARAVGLLSRDFIEQEIGAWINRVNLGTWRTAPNGWWICTMFTPRVHDIGASPPVYEVEVEFDWKQGGWKEDVWYVKSDGTIPGDIVPGVGIRTFQIYGFRRYQDLFPD